jgi:hypothetical protein
VVAGFVGALNLHLLALALGPLTGQLANKSNRYVHSLASALDLAVHLRQFTDESSPSISRGLLRKA